MRTIILFLLLTTAGSLLFASGQRENSNQPPLITGQSPETEGETFSYDLPLNMEQNEINQTQKRLDAMISNLPGMIFRHLYNPPEYTYELRFVIMLWVDAQAYTLPRV